METFVQKVSKMHLKHFMNLYALSENCNLIPKVFIPLVGKVVVFITVNGTVVSVLHHHLLV